MKAKMYVVKMMMVIMVLVQSIALYAGDSYAGEWVNVSGTVYYNGQPLSVMVLANGQYMFTDGANGRYDLSVPLDENGQITLFSFCDGLASFKATLNSWEAGYYAINMSGADPASQSMSITTTQVPSTEDGWVRLIGKVLDQNGNPLCAMVLANGQHMFSCDGNGAYNLEVPLDSDGNITLFGFCDNILPYKEIIPEKKDEFTFGDSGKPPGYDQAVLDFASDSDEFKAVMDQLPPSFDWRDRGVISPSKHQGSCGSCWAFTAVGVMESKIRINGGSVDDLSEQQQISCNIEMNGCWGGTMESLKFWSYQGPVNESCAEYAMDDRLLCSQIIHCETLPYQTGGYYVVNTSDVSEMKFSLSQDGPGYFRFDVYSDFMEFWKTPSPGKVYQNTDHERSGGHAVMIIGWDDMKSAWLCKNSWGISGGPNGDGTFWIAYSVHANDLKFGMGNIKVIGNASQIFSVVSVNPGNNNTGLDVNTKITVSFSEDMDCASMNGKTFYVTAGSEYNLSTVSGTVACSGKTVILTPNSPLDYDTDHTVTITDGAESNAGDFLESDYIWSFRTAKGFTSFTNSLGMTFNLIPAGTFTMGSPTGELGRETDETAYQVTLTKSFYMQTTEITQGQWKAVTGSNPSSFSDCGDNCPVEMVSWDNVQEFILELNKKDEGFYRLPTEAEWEYAARAGSLTAFANGEITESKCGYDQNLDAIGWYCGNSDNATHPASQKQPNGWGLYDMHGNVWEWCQDFYGTYPAYALTDPRGAGTGSSQVIRGGAWSISANNCRSAGRHHYWSGIRGHDLGFRLVRLED